MAKSDRRPPAATEPSSTEPKGLRSLKFPLWVWLISRVVLFYAACVGLLADSRMAVPATMRSYFQGAPIFEAFCRWDCGLYIFISQDGYKQPSDANFFPLLPLLTHGLWFITRIPHQWALLIVSNVASLGAFVVMFRLFRRLADESTARWGVLLFAAYPFAFFYASGYSEPLMVLFSALALDLALRGQHLRAGAALAIGSLSRHVALLAGAGLLLAQVQQRPSLIRFFKSPAWLGLLVAWLGLLGYCVYLKLTFGDFLAFYTGRSAWGDMAYWGILDFWRVGPIDRVKLMPGALSLPFAALVLAGVVITARHKPAWPVASYGLLLSVVFAAIGLVALGRYSSSCWPGFLGWGMVAARRPMVGTLLLSVFTLFQGIFFYMHMHQLFVL